jgi:charged multivesicular body protein 7
MTLSSASLSPPNLPLFDSSLIKPRARLGALYSDFLPLRTLNPDGYAANIQAWRHGLASAARAGVIPSRSSSPELISLTVNSALLRELNTDQCGMPLALGTVARESLAQREWIQVNEFKESKESVYRKGWRVPGIGEVVGWGLRQLGLVGDMDDTHLDHGKASWKVVILENLEEAGRAVMKRMEGHKGRVERIYSKALFKESFEDVLGKKLSEGDIELLLKFLQRDKGVLAFDGETIKFKATGEKAASPITLEDTTIALLKSLIKDLELQTTILTKRVDELGITAKEAVGRKNRVAALAALRSKKLAESTLAKRHATLGQLEEVFGKIEQAADQVELVRVMEASTSVLSGLNREVGGVERVDNVVDQLREQMSQVDEVGDVIAEAGQEAGNVDEAEVDDELEAMERAETEKIEAKERAEKEERERKEAAETKRRLDALEETERQAKEAAKRNAEAEKQLDKSTENMERMSLHPNPENLPA